MNHLSNLRSGDGPVDKQTSLYYQRLPLNLFPLDTQCRVASQPASANLEPALRHDVTYSCLVHPCLDVNQTKGSHVRPCVQPTTTSGQWLPERQPWSLPWVPAVSRVSSLQRRWSAQADAGESVSLHAASNQCVFAAHQTPSFPAQEEASLSERGSELCTIKSL